jgi:hypothetical protein
MDPLTQFNLPPSQTVYTYLEGAKTVGHQYGDWKKLMTALAASASPSSNLPTIIVQGDSSIPKGTWDMMGARLSSKSLATGSITLNLPDGTTLKNLYSIESGLVVAFNNTTQGGLDWDVMSYPPILLLFLASGIVNQGSFPVMDVPDNGFAVIGMLAGSVIATSSPTPVVRLGNNAFFVASDIVQTGGQGFGNDWLEGPVTSKVQYLAGPDFTNPTTPLFLGTKTFQNASQASNINYVPAIPANWVGAPPTNIAEAIGRIAAAIGPVP